MKWDQFVKDYFSFSRKERKAIVGLIILIAIIVVLPSLFTLQSKPVSISENDILKNAIDTSHSSMLNTVNDSEDLNPPLMELSISDSYENASLFNFDPNTLSVEGWQKLGLKERTIKTINNYTSKGGKFYKPEDLKKIWGLDLSFYERVKHHIVIPQKERIQYKTNNYQNSERKMIVLDINTADSVDLIVLPGIGPRLSARIVLFREKLGGFYSVDQIAETYGLPDSTFQKIKKHLIVNPEKIKKLNLNTSTKENLRSHPYINWNIANAIVEYKNQHGNYKNIDEVKKIALINEEIFNKISPYLIL